MVAVSVIIPVYNAEKYLKECLNSITKQTLKNIEIICVDDGSTDRSGVILDDYANHDSRFRIIHQKNQYAGTARNKGMEKASGTYLSFLDADDFFEPDMLEKMYNKALQTQAEIVICESKAYFEQENVYTDLAGAVKKDLFPTNNNTVNRGYFPGKIFQIANGWAWDKLFLNSFVKDKNLYFQSSRTSNDALFVELALVEAERIALLPEVLAYHRTRVAGSLEDSRDVSWENCYDMLKELKRELHQRGLLMEVEQSFHNFALEFLLWNLTTMKTMESYLGLYNKLKNIILPELGLYQKDEYYIYSDDLRFQLELIKKYTAEEFLLKVIGRLHKTLDGLHQSICGLYETVEKLGGIIKRKSWKFPYKKIKKGSKLVIYGAGDVGYDLHEQLYYNCWCKEVLWVDKCFKDYQEKGLPVQSPEKVTDTNFDNILIAMIDQEKVTEVKLYLQSIGIIKEKIIQYSLEQITEGD